MDLLESIIKDEQFKTKFSKKFHHEFITSKKEIKLKLESAEELDLEDVSNQILSATSKSSKLRKKVNEIIMISIKDPEF